MSFLSPSDAADMLADARSIARRQELTSDAAAKELARTSAEQRLKLLFDLSEMAMTMAGRPVDRHLIQGRFYL